MYSGDTISSCQNLSSSLSIILHVFQEYVHHVHAMVNRNAHGEPKCFLRYKIVEILLSLQFFLLCGLNRLLAQFGLLSGGKIFGDQRIMVPVNSVIGSKCFHELLYPPYEVHTGDTMV